MFFLKIERIDQLTGIWWTCLAAGRVIHWSMWDLYCMEQKLSNPVVTTTTQGIYLINNIVFMNGVQMLEFVNGQHIRGIKAQTFDSGSFPHNMIIGRDILGQIGIKIDIEQK